MKSVLESVSHVCLVAVNCLAFVVCSAQNAEAGFWPVPVTDCGVCGACPAVGTAASCPEPKPTPSTSLNCTNSCSCAAGLCNAK